MTAAAARGSRVEQEVRRLSAGRRRLSGNPDSGDAAGAFLSRCFIRAGEDGRADVARRIAALGPDARAGLLELAGWHAVTQAIQGALGRRLAVLPEDYAAYIEATSHLNARRNVRPRRAGAGNRRCDRRGRLAPVFLKGAALVLGRPPRRCRRPAGRRHRPAGRAPAAWRTPRPPSSRPGYRRLPDRVPHAHDPLRLLREDRPGLIELHVAPVGAFALSSGSFRRGHARACAAPPLWCRTRGYPAPRISSSTALPTRCSRTTVSGCRNCGSAMPSTSTDWPSAMLARSTGGQSKGASRGCRAAATAFAFGLLAAREAVTAPLPAPPANMRVARYLAAWRRRGGGPATPIARGSALLGAYAEDWLGRLRRAPDQRRHLVARLLSPRAYPGIVRTLATVATEGAPGDPARRRARHGDDDAGLSLRHRPRPRTRTDADTGPAPLLVLGEAGRAIWNDLAAGGEDLATRRLAAAQGLDAAEARATVRAAVRAWAHPGLGSGRGGGPPLRPSARPVLPPGCAPAGLHGFADGRSRCISRPVPSRP